MAGLFKGRSKAKAPAGEDGIGGIEAQIASLGAGMGFGDFGAEEDQPSSADVNKVVQEVMAAAQKDSAKRKSKAKARVSTSNRGKVVQQDEGEVEADDEGPSSLAEGNECLGAAMKLIRAAVDRDAKSQPAAAALYYDQALEKFGEALDFGVPVSAQACTNLLNSMVGYMDRIHTILSEMPSQRDVASVETSGTRVPYTKLSSNRVKVMQAMGVRGFSCAARGLALRKRAKAELEENRLWPAFLLFSESIDCLVAYMKSDPKGSGNKAVEKAVLEMLDEAENLKKEM
mmetsp:Transcript_24033/g.42401  ORF Transcript_24033/g.42401 Transcript_24033/m.42401 type:complete len:287 (-) Transcript_24033:127-987(-)